MNRRTVLAGAGTLTLASLAGCLGLVGLDEHEATPAGVDPAIRDETGYEETAVDELIVEEDVGALGLSEEIVVTNYLTEHEKTVSMGPLGEQRGAVFIVLSTPQIGVAGQNFNPVEDKSTAELVALVAENYDDIGNVSHDADESITVLDQTTTRSRFTADATFDGIELEVHLHVTEAVETDDDLLVAIGVYPRALQSSEEEHVLDLMRAITADREEGGSHGSTEDGADGGDAGEEGENDGDRANDGGD